MGRDRFVRWNATPPSREAVLTTAREFFGPDVIETAEDEMCVTFAVPMDPSAVHHPLATYKNPCDSPREVEVWFHDAAVNVETRRADAFTNCVADELAAILSWYYGGTIEGGVSRQEYAHFAGEPFWQKRANALTRALEMLAKGGIEGGLVDAHLRGSKRWTSVAGEVGVWSFDGGDDGVIVPDEARVPLSVVATIASFEGRNIASLVESMVPSCD